MYFLRGNIEHPIGELFLWREGENHERSILGTKRRRKKKKARSKFPIF